MEKALSRSVRRSACLAPLLACLCLSIEPGCSSAGPATDATGQERLVTVGGAVTEIVFALGRGATVVGVDTSSVFPVEATRLPKVGYQRTIAAEGILALRPTRVLVSDEAGPPAALMALRSAGIAMAVIPSTPTLDGARQKIRVIAELLGVAERGAQLIDRLEQELKEANEIPVPGLQCVLFLYARGAGTLLVGGSETHADEMIRLSGAKNSAASLRGYKPFSPEALLGALPDVLLITSRGLDSLGGNKGVFQLPGLSLLPAARRPTVVVLDDLLLLGFGPRLGQAVHELRAKLATASQQAVPPLVSAVQP